MKPINEYVSGLLATNQSWNAQDYFSISPSAAPIHKNATLNKIIKDLTALSTDEKDKDHQFYFEVLFIVSRNIATVDWSFKSGTYPIWNSMLSKAKGIAKKKITGKSELDNLSQGLLKNAKTARA